MARAVIQLESSERPYATQHNALAEVLRSAGHEVEIEQAAERPSMPPKEFVLLQAEVVVSVPGTSVEDLTTAIAAALSHLRGRVKSGPRRGGRRRVQIVDGAAM